MGIKESVWVNNIMVVIKIAVVLIFIFVGFRYVEPANWKPFMPFGWKGVMSGAAIVFFAYIGFDAVSTAAEEVKRPQRDLPIGIIASLGICTLLYIVVSAILTGIVPYTKLDTPAPVALAVQYIHQDWVAGLISLGAIAGITTVLLVMLYGQTRIFFAMSRDGLLPEMFSKVHPRFKTVNTLSGHSSTIKAAQRSPDSWRTLVIPLLNPGLRCHMPWESEPRRCARCLRTKLFAKLCTSSPWSPERLAVLTWASPPSEVPASKETIKF